MLTALFQETVHPQHIFQSLVLKKGVQQLEEDEHFHRPLYSYNLDASSHCLSSMRVFQNRYDTY